MSEDKQWGPDMLWGKDMSTLAREALDLSEDYKIFTASTCLSVLRDIEDVTSILGFETWSTTDEIESAIEDAVLSIDLPRGWMLVGLESEKYPGVRTFGLVDFGSLGEV